MTWFNKQKRLSRIHQLERREEKLKLRAKNYEGFKFHKAYGYSPFPVWLEKEKESRAKYPENQFFIHAITLHTLSPSGEEYSFKHYLFKKKDISVHDLVWALKMLEDRNMIHVEKAEILEQMVEDNLHENELEYFKSKLIKKRNKKYYETPES